MERVNKTLQYFWSHLNVVDSTLRDPVKCFRSKTFPASLTGGSWGRFYKALKCYIFSILVLLLSWQSPTSGESRYPLETRVPILLYHRFGPVVADSMTVTTSTFESHLQYLKNHGYTVIPLRHLVDYYLGKKSSLPSRSLVITADDGHKSVYTEMFPLLRKYHIPVTLFLYPSAISNASYAMTWNQLREIKETGLFDFQSHTFWHPNFKEERKRLKPAEYEDFVEKQLKKSRERLQRELDVKVDMLAWPFGIYDEWLIRKIIEAGYVAGFTMERRHASPSENMMALPRYLIVHNDRIRTILDGK
jgi:peptidoglycan/xylan/chitin deacetylase (PgdA/CDA1 family)